MRTYVVRCIKGQFVSETAVVHKHDEMVTRIRVAKVATPGHEFGTLYVMSRNRRGKVVKETKIG